MARAAECRSAPETQLTPADLAELLWLLARGALSRRAARAPGVGAVSTHTFSLPIRLYSRHAAGEGAAAGFALRGARRDRRAGRSRRAARRGTRAQRLSPPLRDARSGATHSPRGNRTLRFRYTGASFPVRGRLVSDAQARGLGALASPTASSLHFPPISESQFFLIPKNTRSEASFFTKTTATTTTRQVDDAALRRLARETIELLPRELEAYRCGKTALERLFIGKTIGRSGGRADPVKTGDAVRAVLAELVLL